MTLAGRLDETARHDLQCARRSTPSATAATRRCPASCRLSGYTYAVEFSVDEAVDAGATRSPSTSPSPPTSRTSSSFPVGNVVPAATTTARASRWVPAPTRARRRDPGRSPAETADIDPTATARRQRRGSRRAGHHDAERIELAQLYSAGQTLWRTQVGHFSPWDYNWPYGLPDGARAPNAKVLPSDRGPGGDGGGSTEDDPCKQGGGSTIECQNQTLTEDLLLFGTPFRLHYESDRVPGRTDLNSKSLQVIGETVPPQLEAITVNVSVAGKTLFLTAPVVPNAAVRFTWDGKDGFGRAIQGDVPFQARIRYQYPAVYKPGSSLGGAASFAQASGSFFAFEPTRLKIFLTSEISGTVGALRATQTGEGLDVGGWTLDVHHVYDARTQTLHRGDGDRVSSQDSLNQIDTVAGGAGFGNAKQVAHTPTSVALRAGFAYIADREARVIRKLHLATGDETIFAGTGGKRCSAVDRPATLAQFAPEGLDFDAEGNLYVADPECASVWKIDVATGIVNRVAGNGQRCSGGGACGDGGPATAATLGGGGIDIAVDAEKNIYIADAILDRVRRVAANGVITNFAGSGLTLGDGGPATSARLDDPRGLAVDGNVVFIADYRQHRIRRVTGGTITTIAGTGVKGTTGDGGSATAAQIDQPWDVAVSAGIVYFSQGGVLGVGGQKRVRRITGGTIDTVAGRSDGGFSGDGGPATEAELSAPSGIALDSGSLFIADFGNRRVRRVRPDQTIDTIAGSGVVFGRGDGSAAVEAQLDRPRGVAYDAIGNLYIAEAIHGRVRRVDAATGVITTFAGGGAPSGGIGDGLPATAALLDMPVGIVVDPDGNVFIAERGGNRVRKVDTAGIITTYAGTGTGGSSGDGGPATAALLQGPLAIALDGGGNLYISGRDDRVRKVDPGGQITTFAGGGSGAGHGDGGPAVAAKPQPPRGPRRRPLREPLHRRGRARTESARSIRPGSSPPMRAPAPAVSPATAARRPAAQLPRPPE